MNSDSKSQGLVICAINVRIGIKSVPPVSWETRRIASMFPQGDPKYNIIQGERIFLSINPGMLRISRTNTGKRHPERTIAKRKPIQKWTKKSRTNMVSKFSSLDYTPMFEKENPIPVMITLTYPGDWLTVAPSAKASKAHLTSFRKRFERRFGIKLQALWRAEFQRRGAVHFHLFCVSPVPVIEFREWVAKTWAAVVKHPDPEQRRRHRIAGTAVDIALGSTKESPKRIAIYFAKHSSPNIGAKEYQNQPPIEWIEAGSVGRFWGYWNMGFQSAIVELDLYHALFISRTLRKWHRAQDQISKKRVRRVNIETGEAKYRWVSRRVKRFPKEAGFLIADCGLELADSLARALLAKFDNHSLPRSEISKTFRDKSQR
jgi:hypothetical protein